jgi:hypothetical protein
LLRDIEHNNGLAPSEKQELASSINHLERHYFQTPQPQEPNLEQIASKWVNRTSI